jgi:hypothetical protein
MKTLILTLIAASALLLAVFGVLTTECGSREHGSKMPVQGRPVTAWVAEVEMPGGFGASNPSLTLGRVGANSPEAIAALKLALSDTNSGVRVLARKALGIVEDNHQ